jgi:serine/threonine protein phosphatase PrpC
MQTGERPARAHGYVFVAERDERRCALLVGREFRDDWDERTIDDTPAAARVLARADELFLPLTDGNAAERLDRFRKGFLQMVTQSQRELQAGAEQRAAGAPSLTLTLAYVDGRRRLYVGHVGDDRCYVFRAEKLHRMTTDHTLVPSDSDQPVVKDPLLTRKLLNVVGGFSDDLETETLATELEPNDIVLLCTPAVHAAIPEPALEEALLVANRDPSMPLGSVADAIFRAVPQPERSEDRALALTRLRHESQEQT